MAIEFIRKFTHTSLQRGVASFDFWSDLICLCTV
jgi:hypothetical protein